MCKLLAVLDIENDEDALLFTEAAVKPMTDKDDDGLGTIMLGPDGVGVERWRHPRDFPNTLPLDPALLKFADLIEPTYNSDGPLSQEKLWALGVHSRFATCGKSLTNTHPFVREDLALIHNGVISNHAQIDKVVSSCDSEALLTKYLEYDVRGTFANIQSVCDSVTGWYAFMVFSKEGYVDIIRDSQTDLFFAHVSGVGIVFATTEHIIKSSAGRIKTTVSDIYPMPDNCAIRWRLGKPLEVVPLRERVLIHSSKAVTADTPAVVDVSKSEAVDVHTDLDRCEHGQMVGNWCLPCYERDLDDNAGALPYSRRKWRE